MFIGSVEGFRASASSLNLLQLYLTNTVKKDSEQDVEDDGGGGDDHHRLRLDLELVGVETVDRLEHNSKVGKGGPHSTE